MVVIGGGAGSIRGGSNGGGGFREGYRTGDSYTVSPLGGFSITLTAQTYPITVGSAVVQPQVYQIEANGLIQYLLLSHQQVAEAVVMIFMVLFSRSAETVAQAVVQVAVANSNNGSGGAGNTPPVSPPQGNSGGAATSPDGQGKRWRRRWCN